MSEKPHHHPGARPEDDLAAELEKPLSQAQLCSLGTGKGEVERDQEQDDGQGVVEDGLALQDGAQPWPTSCSLKMASTQTGSVGASMTARRTAADSSIPSRPERVRVRTAAVITVPTPAKTPTWVQRRWRLSRSC